MIITTSQIIIEKSFCKFSDYFTPVTTPEIANEDVATDQSESDYDWKIAYHDYQKYVFTDEQKEDMK